MPLDFSDLVPGQDAGDAKPVVPQTTFGRARDVYTGLVARGMDVPTAFGYGANAVGESGADPYVKPGDKGASHGPFQWQGDRLRRYVALYGHLPEQGNLDEHLDYVMYENSGPEADAWAQIQRAAPTAAAKAAAIARYWERPADADGAARHRAGIANQLLAWQGNQNQQQQQLPIRRGVSFNDLVPQNGGLSFDDLVPKQKATTDDETGMDGNAPTPRANTDQTTGMDGAPVRRRNIDEASPWGAAPDDGLPDDPQPRKSTFPLAQVDEQTPRAPQAPVVFRDEQGNPIEDASNPAAPTAAQLAAPAPDNSLAGYNNAVMQAVPSTGAAIAGMGEAALRGQLQSNRRMLAAMDGIDSGNTATTMRGLNEVDRGMASQYLRAPPEQRAQMRAAAQQDATALAAPGANNAMIRTGKEIQDYGKATFPMPENPSFGQKVVSGASSMVPLLGAGIAGGAVGGPIGAVAATLPIIGGQVYDQTLEEATKSGLGPDAAAQAAGISALTQMGIMATPIGRVIGTHPTLAPGLTAAIANLGKRGAEFGTFNSIATLAENYVTQHLVDPKRDLMQGVAEAAAIGAVTGGAMGIPGVVRGARQSIDAARLDRAVAGMGTSPYDTAQGKVDARTQERQKGLRRIGGEGSAEAPDAPFAPPEPAPEPPPASAPASGFVMPPRPNQPRAPRAPVTPEAATVAPEPPRVEPVAEPPRAAEPAPAVEPTTPEPRSDIQAQIDAMADPKNSKDAVFVAAGNEGAAPAQLPKGTLSSRRPEGMFFTTNPRKLKAFNEGPLTDEKLAGLLGYPETKADAIASGQTVVVEAKNPDGDVVASTLASPAGIDAAKVALEPQVPEGGKVEVISAVEAQTERGEKAAAEVAPPAPAPVTPAKGQRWAKIGENEDGNPVFQDANGVRSFTANGVRQTENVGVKPGGGITVAAPDAKAAEFMPVAKPADASLAPGEHPGKPGTKAPERPIEPPKAEEPKAEPPPNEGPGVSDGSDNKFFTKDAAERARARLKEKLSRMNAGFDPEFALDGMTLAGFHIERGLRKFVDYSKAMIADLGEAARPHLKQFYNTVRDQHEFDTRGMDDHAAVETELKKAQESPPAPEKEAGNADRPERDPLGEPGSEQAGGEGDGSRKPAGDRPSEGLETKPADDVSRPDGGGDRPENGPGAGPETVGGKARVRSGRNAANGRGGTGKQRVAAAGPREQKPEPASVRPNFHIDDPERIAGGTPKVRFERNRSAIETLGVLEAEQRAPTPDEAEAIAGYTGWGSYGQDLFQGTFERQPPRKGWDAEGKWLRDHMGKEAWESAQRSIINAHYTDPPTVKTMWDMMANAGFKGGRILEPSMGIGNFFGMMPRDVMGKSALTGIELDRTTGQMAKILYPDAGVHIKGYQDSHTPDNFYDLVIGNWPFAANSPADRRYDKLSPSLHDYFFLKALDQTRPGGIVLGVTSAGTMDKASRATRLELAKKGELIAAFRLPSGAFENYAGTSVVTDILMFRKRDQAPASVLSEPWLESKDMKVEGGTIRVNQYFQDHPENVLGTFAFDHGTTSGRPGMVVRRPDNLMDRLAELPGKIEAGTYHPTIRGNEPRFVSNNTDARQNNVVIGDGKKLYQVKGDRLVLLEDLHKIMKSGTAKAAKDRDTQVRKLVGLGKAYGELIDAERSGAPDTEKRRSDLMGQFKAFRDAHGTIGVSEGLRVLDRVKDPSAAIIEALERPDGTPSRILSEPMVRARKALENPSISDAYVMARNEQKNFDIERVAALAKTTPEEAAAHLIDSGAVLLTPGGGLEAADGYLSGNVRKKMREAEAALANGEPMEPSIEKLKSVMPKHTPYYQIEAKFGAPWASDQVYKDFLADLLGLKGRDKDDVQVRFAGSRWRVGFGNDRINYTPEAQTIHGHPRYPFNKLVMAAMGNRVVRIMDTTKDGGRVLNQAATDEVNAKIMALRERFVDWAWKSPTRKMELEKSFNENMNAIARTKFDGSFLDMSGMALRRGEDPFSMRQHQLAAIWRGISLGRGLFAHEVGTGKSYTMAGIAVEGRRYGVFRKPLVLAHNANSASVAREFQDMYPGGKFLYIDNLSPDTIDAAMHRIANDDWDAVVMPHSLIDRMTLSEDTLKELAADQIAELETEALEAAREDGVNLTPQMMDDAEAMKKVRSPTAKQLVHQRQAILDNIQKQANRSAREGALSFEKLGVDALIVDEAHEFKKPPITTQMKLKGLNTATSNRSIALKFLSDYTTRQNNGKGVFLFTGTPITNSLNEIYNMSRYFMSDRLEQAGVKDWDTWFNTFADALTDVELNAAGTLEPVKRLSTFVNIDELVRTMSEFTDVVQAKSMPEFVDRQTPSGKTLSSSDLTAEERDFLTNGRIEKPEGRPYKKIVMDVGQMSPGQSEIFDDLKERLAHFKATSGRAKMDLVREGYMLKIGSDASKASLDGRSVNSVYPEDPNGKIARIMRNVMMHYAEPRSAQVIFVDSGYNKSEAEGSKSNFVPVVELVNKLVEAGIPRHEIAVVNGRVSAEKKKAIADAINAGSIRIAIGLSSTLGVGVNMQRNLRAMHHWDAPWRPGDLEQRNGRGERQGNEWNTVLEYRYVTEGIDGRRWSALNSKDRFIKKFINAFNDESGKRIGSIEGDAADISDGEDIMETLSAAAGDPRLMVREKLKADVDRLQKRERMHVQGQVEAKHELDNAVEGIRRETVRADKLEKAVAVWQSASDRAADDAKKAGDTHRWYEAEVDGKPLRVGGDIQEAMESKILAMKPGDKQILATINGFKVEADFTRFAKTEPEYSVVDPSGERYDMISPTIPRITAGIGELKKVAANYRVSIEDRKDSIPRFEEAMAAGFPHQEAMNKKKLQLSRLEADLQDNPTPPPSWLRFGAPIDSEIFVNGKPQTVRGHQMGDDYYLMTDEGRVPYLEAKTESGVQVFEPHDPPPQATEAPAKPGASPGDVKFSRKAAGSGDMLPPDGMPSMDAVQAAVDATHAMLGGKGRVEVYSSPDGLLSYKMPDGSVVKVSGLALGRVIKVALTKDGVGSALNHEAMHALKNMGVFTKGEWKVLEAAADRGKWIERYGIEDRYPNLDRAGQIEEALAEHFAATEGAKGSKADPLMTRLGTKLRNWLDRFRNLLAGRGFKSASDVFGSVSRGEVGAREAGSGMPERGPRTVEDSARRLSQGDDVRFSVPARVKEASDKLRDLAKTNAVARQLVRAGDNAVAIKHATEALISPLAIGSKRAQTAAFELANALRNTVYTYGLIDKRIMKEYNAAERENIGRAMDNQSVFEQELAMMDPDTRRAMEAHDRGAFDAGRSGVAGLPPEQRKDIEAIAARAMEVWNDLRDVGRVPPGAEGLPYFFARQMVMRNEDGSISRAGGDGGGGRDINQIGKNIGISKVRNRKHLTPEGTEAAGKAVLGENAELIRDIRSVVQKLAVHERTVATARLIDKIKAAGEAAGVDTVIEGEVPSHLNPNDYFTINHPVFRKWSGSGWQDIRVLNEYKGPLEAVLSTETGKFYQGLMKIKGVTMLSIMWSPFMHLGVEMGRAFPLMPGKIASLKFIREGTRLLDDNALMDQAIRHGMAPIGKGWSLDAVKVAEEAILKEASSPAGKLFEKIAGIHERWLWDNVLKLQVTIYKHMKDKYEADGLGPEAAGISAAHLSNRFAGALPPEMLSKFANQAANIILFSRSYTLGNLGVMKDAATGAPRVVRAALEEAVGPEQAAKAIKMLKSTARKTVVADIAVAVILTALVQTAFQYANDAMDKGMSKAASFVWSEYLRKTKESFSKIDENPFNAIGFLPQHQNEQGKKDRAFIGHDIEGRGTYFRVMAGKVGEEFIGWMFNPGTMFLNKLSPLVKPILENIQNADSLGRKIYRPDPETPGDYARVFGRSIQHFVAGQGPIGQIIAHPAQNASDAKDLIDGGGSKDRLVQAAKIALPAIGLGTVSVGHPAGEEAGQDAANKRRMRFDIQEAIPEARKLFKTGKVNEGYELLEKAGADAKEKQNIYRYSIPEVQAGALRRWGNLHGIEGPARPE